MYQIMLKEFDCISKIIDFYLYLHKFDAIMTNGFEMKIPIFPKAINMNPLVDQWIDSAP